MSNSSTSSMTSLSDGQQREQNEKVEVAPPLKPSAGPPSPLDWESSEDPENPMNWTLLKKCLHIAPVALLCFAVTAGSSMVTPAIPGVEAHFEVSREAAILSLSLFVLGLGIGPAIAAPLSEVFGRSIVYKITAPVYMLFILGAGFSTKSFGGFLVCRLLAGMAGAPCLAVGAGTIADMFPNRVRAIPSSIYVMAPFLGPSLGPVIGGFIAYYKNWQWTQWCTIFLGFIAFVGVLPMQETYKKVILRRRAISRGIPQPPSLSAATLKLLATVTIIRPVVMLYREPLVTFFSAYNAFAFSVLFAFFAAFPYVFETVYDFNSWQYGLTFIGIGIGVILAVITSVLLDRVVYHKKYLQAISQGSEIVGPEHRLYIGMVGSFGITIGLFWFAWTARPGVHWIWPTLAGIPFAWGNLSIFIAAALYLIDTYGPLNGASALAANGLLRYTLGAAFPLFTLQMYERLGIAWATSLLAFLSLALLPIPWIIFKYGPSIRKRSRYSSLK